MNTDQELIVEVLSSTIADIVILFIKCGILWLILSVLYPMTFWNVVLAYIGIRLILGGISIKAHSQKTK
jgi:hypothetical protein